MITLKKSVRLTAATALVAGLAGLAPLTAVAAEEPVQTDTIALSAEAQILKTLLEARLDDPQAIDAYAAQDFEPIWIASDGTARPSAISLIAALMRAGEHALPAAKYNGAGLAQTLSKRTKSAAELEVDFTTAFLSYASDLSAGILTPRDVDRELYVFPERPDHGALLSAVAASENVDEFLTKLSPQGDDYNRLLARRADLQESTLDWGERVAKGKTLRPGDRSPRVASLRDRLAALGDLDVNAYERLVQADGTQIAENDTVTDAPVQSFEEEFFDEILADAVMRFQERHGLNTDGVIGPATLRQLNTSLAERTNQIAVNLERMRWMNRDLGERHILVNLAGFTMTVLNKGEPEFTSRVVVGKARKHRTPEFSDEMSHMVVNPSWNVPKSIAHEEILPKLQENPSYLQENNMQIVDADFSTEEIDWTTVTPATFPGRIKQLPGDGNALGTVKFMFPNRFAIYLHDTPSRKLFQRDVRAYSHGCVRVEKPRAFAEFLLNGQAANPAEYFQKLRDREREIWVKLDTPLPIHLTYRTAWVDKNGVDQFRGDIYGRDAKIAAALSEVGVSIIQ